MALNTFHLLDHDDPDSFLVFSANDRLLARSSLSSGGVTVWDLHRRIRCFDASSNKFGPLRIPPGPGFSTDGLRLITCRTQEVLMWMVDARTPTWNKRLLKRQWGWGVDWAEWRESPDTIIIVIDRGRRTLELSARSGETIREQKFCREPGQVIGIIRANNDIQPILCLLCDRTANKRARVVFRQAFDEEVILTIELNADEKLVLSPNYEAAVVCRCVNPGTPEQLDLGEVWSLKTFARRNIPELLLPLWSENVVIGFKDRYLASGSPDLNHPRAELRIWDLVTGNCIGHFPGIFPNGIRWPSGSNLLAISTEQLNGPGRFDRWQLRDPFGRALYGEVLGHWPEHDETYRISRSGTWLASFFVDRTTTADGRCIPAGTIAVSELPIV